MNLQQLDNYITDRYTSSLTEENRKNHINEVYFDLTRAFTPDITETNDSTLSTVADEAIVALSWGARQIKRIFVQDGPVRHRLRRVSEQALLRSGDSDLPRFWAPYGNTQSGGVNYLRFFLSPAPDAIYPLVLDYEPVPDILAANTDIPEYFPAEYHYLIAWGVLAILASQQEDWEVAQAWEARFRGTVNEMLTTLGIAAPENYPMINMVKQEAVQNA